MLQVDSIIKCLEDPVLTARSRVVLKCNSVVDQGNTLGHVRTTVRWHNKDAIKNKSEKGRVNSMIPNNINQRNSIYPKPPEVLLAIAFQMKDTGMSSYEIIPRMVLPCAAFVVTM